MEPDCDETTAGGCGGFLAAVFGFFTGIIFWFIAIAAFVSIVRAAFFAPVRTDNDVILCWIGWCGVVGLICAVVAAPFGEPESGWWIVGIALGGGLCTWMRMGLNGKDENQK